MLMLCASTHTPTYNMGTQPSHVRGPTLLLDAHRISWAVRLIFAKHFLSDGELILEP
jgi:hypothetical protein